MLKPLAWHVIKSYDYTLRSCLQAVLRTFSKRHYLYITSSKTTLLPHTLSSNSQWQVQSNLSTLVLLQNYNQMQSCFQATGMAPKGKCIQP